MYQLLGAKRAAWLDVAGLQARCQHVQKTAHASGKIGAALTNFVVEAPLRWGHAALFGNARCHGLVDALNRCARPLQPPLAGGPPPKATTRLAAVGMQLRWAAQQLALGSLRAIGLLACCPGYLLGVLIGLGVGCYQLATIGLGGQAAAADVEEASPLPQFTAKKSWPAQLSSWLASWPTPAQTLIQGVIHPATWLYPHTPAAPQSWVDVPHERFNFCSADGTLLEGFLVEAAVPVQPQAYVVWMHGSAQRCEDRLPSLQALANQAQVTIVCSNGRGIAGSQGREYDTADEIADCRALLLQTQAMAERTGVPLGAYGWSLGGAVLPLAVTSLLDEKLFTPKTLTFLLSEYAFQSLPQVASAQLGLPRVAPVLNWAMRALQLDPLDAGAAIRSGPLAQQTHLRVAGADQVIPRAAALAYALPKEALAERDRLHVKRYLASQKKHQESCFDVPSLTQQANILAACLKGLNLPKSVYKDQ